MSEYEVAVIGLGVMGSAAAAALAERGRRIIGIERFAPIHERGSSHGATRIIRLGYFEHPSYVPLLRAAYPLWRKLEARSGQALLTVTGILEMGDPAGDLVAGTLRASRLHGVPHDILDAESLMRRFPAFRVPPHFIGVFQPDGGFVRAEATIAALQRIARDAGAALRFDEPVDAIEPARDGVLVKTSRGDIRARAAIVAAGPWLAALLPWARIPVRVTRQVLAWFRPAEAVQTTLSAAGGFPVFLLQNPDGIFYGFPADRDGLKVAKHHHAGETVEPDRYDRRVSAGDEAMVREGLKAVLPAADGDLVAARTCLYTMTPDGDFILDRVPGAPRIIVASPCSGHGFKFAPVVGEVLADLAVNGETHHDISRFSLARFA